MVCFYGELLMIKASPKKKTTLDQDICFSLIASKVNKS